VGFREAQSSLTRFGYACHVQVDGSAVDVRVESQGSQVYGMKIQLRD